MQCGSPLGCQSPATFVAQAPWPSRLKRYRCDDCAVALAQAAGGCAQYFRLLGTNQRFHWSQMARVVAAKARKG